MPELKVALLVVAVIAFAYVAIYPRMRSKTLMRMTLLDLALTAGLLLAVGAVYFGTGTEFSLLLFSVPWWVFTLLVALVIELPLFFRFCKKHGIDINPPLD